MKRNSVADLGDVWPPGFRFHPTDEELVLYYLKRKICHRKLKLDIISELDVYKWDPEELPVLSLLKTGDRQWFFFCPRDRKYPNGSRSNRATHHGYWKTTGKDRTISCNSRTVGLKKSLIFYRGRAPSGERTDWVMHEYTLEESELKRCQDVQDCYALYKLYKKSGSGPRNGEDYGAPFREEDWSDEEFPQVSRYIDPANHGKLSNGIAYADIHGINPQVQCTWDDIEEFMKHFVDDPAPDGPDIADCEYTIPQVYDEEGQSILTDPPSSEKNIQGCLSFRLSDTSLVQLQNAYGVDSSGVNNTEQHEVEEDFLEMDDLLGPVITHDVGEYIPQPAGELNVSSQWGEVDGFSELDMYDDPGMFFRDLSPINQASASHPWADSQASKLMNTNDLERRSSDAMNYMGPQQEMYDQDDLCATSGEPNPDAMPFPSTGDLCAGNFTPNVPESISNEIQNGKGAEGDDTWYTSALLSFVESIPTTPASAADSAWVNRAFERMSSFTRLRLNPKSTTAAAIAEAASSGSTGGRMKGFFLLSFPGVLFEIFFVLMDIFGEK